MNSLFHWLRSPVQARQPAETKSYLNSMIAWQGYGDASWTSADPGSLSRAGFLNNPVVYRCVRMIGEAAASIPWLARDGKQEFDTHPLLDLLNNPGSHHSGAALFERVYGHLLVNGNAFLQVTSLEGSPRELHALAPDRTSVITGPDGHPAAYDYQVGSRKIRYENNDDKPLLHLAQFNPAHEILGHSPLAAAHKALDIHNAASNWNKALLDNSARPSGALVYSSREGGNLTEDQFGRLKQELEEGYSGAVRAGRPMVLEGGLDWKAMGYSPRDMDFMEAKNGASRDIALAFGVPPMLLGIPGDNTYSNYKEANRAFWVQTVIPLVQRTASAVGNWLAPRFDDDIQLGFDRDAIDALAGDRSARWTQISQAGFLTRNEKRAALGYGPIEDGGSHDDEDA